MKDGPWRRVVKRVALTRYVADLTLTRALQRLAGEPRFRLRGTCANCGACCETPAITVHAAWYHFKSLRWLILSWHRVVNGWELLETERRSHTFVFRCTHWDPASKQCDAYASRPGMCRDYPRNLLYSTNPLFLDGCGHYALDRRAAEFRAALAKTGLPPEKMAEVERRLHLCDRDASAE